ncbi:MAG: hypothetical protein U0T31_01565 [Chitinophagales bacterium]
MKIIIKPLAQKTIQRIAEYVEDLNTEGAGAIWAENLILSISK